MSRAAIGGTVYLVGAGPGDPELLTLRAADLLRTADVILPDDLVSDEVLALSSPTALIVPVGKRCGQPRVTQAGIHELMLEHAGGGASVVRLKSGDPLVFGRATEEMEALRGAGIPFEIVPGISTAFAVAAALQLPLTDRTHASRLVLATAHHAAGKVELSPDWTGTLLEDATLVIYMPGRDLHALRESLLRSGLGAETPCVVVSSASTPQQEVRYAALATLAEVETGAAPVIVLLGRALRAADVQQPGR